MEHAAGPPMPAGLPRATAPASECGMSLDTLAQDLGTDIMLAATRQFEQDAGVFVSRLSAAQEAGECAGVQKAAHGLKGLFRQFGVPDLAQVAESLNRNPAAGSPDTASAVRHIVAAAPAAIAGVLAYAEQLARAAR